MNYVTPETKNSMDSYASTLDGKAAGAAHTARDALSSAARHLSENYKGMRKSLGAASTENVLASVGVGLVIGRVLSIRSRRDL